MVNTLETAKNKVLYAYDDFRQNVSSTTKMWRRMDACEAVTADIIKIVNKRITGVEGDFDGEKEKRRLCLIRPSICPFSLWFNSFTS